MPSRSIQLNDQDLQFVEEQVSSGTYRDASEVLGAGLRLLEQQLHSDTEKLSRLRSLADEGFADIDQGRGFVLHNESEVAELIRRIGEVAATPSREGA